MLSVRDISVRYDEREVLRDVGFELRDGEVIVLLGANGAGKTTLIKALNASLPVAAGEILLDGRPLWTYSRREIAQGIAVVAQENETRFPVTVLEFILSGRFARGTAFGWETAEDNAIADRAMRQCDLENFGGRVMNELSGGERQRAVLARALATESRILLLDEPTANLDLAHQALMFRLVRERCRVAGCSAVVITHDLNLAAEFADSVILLKNERIFASGKPIEVLTEANLKEVFEMRVLLDEHPVSGNVRVTTVY